MDVVDHHHEQEIAMDLSAVNGSVPSEQLEKLSIGSAAIPRTPDAFSATDAWVTGSVLQMPLGN